MYTWAMLQQRAGDQQEQYLGLFSVRLSPPPKLANAPMQLRDSAFMIAVTRAASGCPTSSSRWHFGGSVQAAILVQFLTAADTAEAWYRHAPQMTRPRVAGQPPWFWQRGQKNPSGHRSCRK
jgi:hypothetical protein